jgi:hypothetical protein
VRVYLGLLDSLVASVAEEGDHGCCERRRGDIEEGEIGWFSAPSFA